MAEWLLAQGFGIIKDVISKNMEELLVKDNKELKEKNELIIRIKSLTIIASLGLYPCK